MGRGARNGKNPNRPAGSQNDVVEAATRQEGKGFFYACYLLNSLCPRFKGRNYIGYTVNPRRRIRQHNGEITSGASRTKKYRPWEMVLCIYGFPTNVSALQFEWAWQHPRDSVAVREAASTFKTFSGLTSKIKLAYTMLNLPPWQSLDLVVNYFSTKHTKHFSGCPSLPRNMRVQFRAMDELPCYLDADASLFEDEDRLEEEEDEEEYKDASGLIGSYGESCKKVKQQETMEASNDTSDITEEILLDALDHISPDHANSSKETSYDQLRWHQEYQKRQRCDLPTAEIDHVRPLGFLDSLVKTTASGLTTSAAAEMDNDRANRFYAISKQTSDIDARDSAEYAKHAKEAFPEHWTWYEEYSQCDPRARPASEVDHDPPPSYGVFDSPLQAAPTVITCPPTIEITDDSPSAYIQEKKELRRTGSEHQDIEVIDLLSPIPVCANSKRRISVFCPEIIDLT